MAELVVGIDLGTTFSVVAVPGQYPEKGVVFGPVTVLWDEVQRLTHASAVCQVDNELIVGNDAKVRAAEGYAPARFVKKYMGTTKTFQVGDEEWPPEKVSAEVLRHMRRIAEKALGCSVKGAVITHPAYFDGLAINATKEAGRQAGLNVAGLIMEPIAAAMAYTHADKQPYIRVLVYDFGGGTFDITLVERTASGFRPVAFGGDRELGGYNIDKKIATRMLEALRKKGYQLTIDPERPERDGRWASLMHHAEQLKFKLSEQNAAKGDVRVSDAFRDNSTPTKSVQLSFSMTQAEFCELIEPEIAKTVEETWKVLKAKNLAPSDVHYLLLVGGSSRIWAVQQRLRKEFQLEPRFDEDVVDLSVAMGAAMVAAASGTTEDGVAMNAIPAKTSAKNVVFSGQVLPAEGRTEVGGLRITVDGGVQGEQTDSTRPDGRFYIEAELYEETDNELSLTISTPDGTQILSRQFRVTHQPGVRRDPTPPPPMLPKPISVETVSGFRILAREGVNLPFKSTERFKTVEELEEIPITLYQEDIQLATVVLTGFSRPVPADWPVDLEIELAEDFELRVTASVPSTPINKTQVIKLPPVDIPSKTDLCEEFHTVRQLYQSQLENTPDGPQKAAVGLEADRLIEDIEELLLRAEFVENFQVYMLIKKLYVLVKQLTPEGLTPSQSAMEERFQEARQLLPRAIEKDPALRDQDLAATLDALTAESHRAWQQRDSRAWSNIASKLDELVEALKARLAGGGGISQLPPAPIVRAYFLGEVKRLRGEVAGKGDRLPPQVAAKCNEELDVAERKLGQIDMSDDEAAKRECILVYQQHLTTVEELAGVQSREGGPKIK